MAKGHNARSKMKMFKYLTNKAFKIGKLAQGHSHLLHAIDDRTASDGLDKRLLELLKPLKESLLRLLRRVLQAAYPHHLLLC